MTRNRYPIVPCLIGALALCLALPAFAAADGEEGGEKNEAPTTLGEALTDGDVSLILRYRFENVSEDTVDKDANASTLRTVLNYRSQAYKRFSLFLEFENVTDIGLGDQHNNAGAGDLNNGIGNRPVIADPEITEVNQAYLRLDLGAGTLVDLGRREIVLDNHRWVGNVGWRQNHQSFDALTLVGKPSEKSSVTYAYVDNVNRIFGDNRPMASHLLNIGYEFGFGKLTGYGYLLDFDSVGAFGLSTATYGLRLAGAHELAEKRKIRYEVEYAQQSDAGDNPDKVGADYYLLKLGGNVGSFNFDLAREVLGADKGRITTPLATLHAHNGWADKFLNTPPDGLVDSFVSIGWGDKGWTAKVVYHDFQSDQASIDYGTELDLLLTKRIACGATIGLKGALYGADAFSTDTEKFWLWAARSF